MKKTILFGGSGFLGPVILNKNPEIISVGRSELPEGTSNQHITIKSLDDLKVLDAIDFDKVIFLIGSSNHHEINNKVTINTDLKLEPIDFTTELNKIPIEDIPIFAYTNVQNVIESSHVF